MIKIATSILSADDRIKSIKKLNKTSTDYVHIDVMDNKFVPNYQLPLKEVNELGNTTKKPFDIHLMMEDPEPYIKKLTIKNIDCITIHIEIDKNIDYLIDLIKSHNYKVGLAIKPNTNLDLLDKYLHKIDKVIIMSVEPGFGGQKFLPDSTKRCQIVKRKKDDIIIEVDGGINDKTIDLIKDTANIAVVGSYIINQEDYEKAINNLKN